jgi:O-antigen/teichoic acid export membrane protein
MMAAGHRLRRVSQSRGSTISIVDQGVTSASNFLLVVLVARNSDAPTFGIFALLFLLVTLVVACAYSLVSEPLLTFRPLEEASTGQARRGAATVAVFLGLLGSAILLVVGRFTHSSELGLLLAVACPIAVLQDHLRYQCFDRGSAATALLADTMWLAVFVGAVVAMEGEVSYQSLVMTWTAGAAFSALLMVRRNVLPFSARDAHVFVVNTAPMQGTQLTEFASVSLEGQFFAILVAATSGATVLGGYRGAQSLLGPLSVFFLAMRGGLLARARHLSPEDGLRRLVRNLSIALAVLTVVVAIVLSSLPNEVGALILGPTWPGARAVLPLLGAQYLGLALCVAPILGLRVLRAGRLSSRARLRTTGLYIGAAILGMTLVGMPRAVAFLAGAGLLSALDWQLTIRRGIRESSERVNSGTTGRQLNP